jgi:pimeloyl-ACP methyl ester carboxylesterase
MKTRPLLLLIAALACLSLGTAKADQPDGAYLDGGKSTVGVILLHGRFSGRGGPDSPVVGPLRKALHDRLGVHTLSLEYPQTNRSRSASDEEGNFPAAHERIDQAIKFLTQEKGVTQIYLMGHSLGTRITISYMAANKDIPNLRGYIGVGIYGAGQCQNADYDPLATFCNLKTVLGRNPAFPVLDVVAMDTSDDVRYAERRTELVSATYQQIRIDADHDFKHKEGDMLDTVTDWLKKQAGL